MLDAPRPGPGPRCPTCRRPISWSATPTRPFCTLACRLIDLGRWLGEAYRVPGPPLPLELGPGPDATRGGE